MKPVSRFIAGVLVTAQISSTSWGQSPPAQETPRSDQASPDSQTVQEGDLPGADRSQWPAHIERLGSMPAQERNLHIALSREALSAMQTFISRQRRSFELSRAQQSGDRYQVVLQGIAPLGLFSAAVLALRGGSTSPSPRGRMISNATGGIFTVAAFLFTGLWGFEARPVIMTEIKMREKEQQLQALSREVDAALEFFEMARTYFGTNL